MRRFAVSLVVTSLLAVTLLPASTPIVASSQRAPARNLNTSKRPRTGPTTTTTVMGGGNPSTWPAAKPDPPSLAGAYSPNMKTAFLALTNYSDWVGTHPSPKLVGHYAAIDSNIYKPQVYLLQQLDKLHWHLPPTPTEIDFLVVTKKPTLRRTRKGAPESIGGHRAYTDGIVDVVIRELTESYLNVRGEVVGHTARGTGPKAWTVTLTQTPTTGQFVIGSYYAVQIRGSLMQWEHTVRTRE